MITVDRALQAAIAHHHAGRLAEAEQVYRRVLAQFPSHAGALHLLGVIALQKGRPADAIASIRRAIAVDARQSVFHSNLGEAHRKLGELELAQASYERAIELDPNLTEAHSNLGLALQAQGDITAAARQLERALELDPNFAEAHNNLGLALQAQGDITAAARQIERAIQIRPNYVDAHYNLGRLLLLQGDFERGWREYAWRLHISGHPSQKMAAPKWDGSPLGGKRLFIYAEQGLGDTLQFIRYVSRVKDRVGEMVVAVQAKLIPQLTASGFDNLLPLDSPTPACDAQCSLLSLPRLLGTTLETVPAEIPYLRAEPCLVERWRGMLEPTSEFKVGIVWQGNPAFYSDRFRSIPLAALEPLAKLPGVRLISLQVGDAANQIDELDGRFEVTRLDDWDVDHITFMDTAAVMANLDLIVTSDTAAAHLAGALGVPVWVALCASPCWRWLLERSDSPWYPTMRLFRQSQMGEWTGVFAAVADAITHRWKL